MPAPARQRLRLQRMRIRRGLGIMAGGGVALRFCCVGYVALLYGGLYDRGRLEVGKL